MVEPFAIAREDETKRCERQCADKLALVDVAARAVVGSGEWGSSDNSSCSSA